MELTSQEIKTLEDISTGRDYFHLVRATLVDIYALEEKGLVYCENPQCLLENQIWKLTESGEKMLRELGDDINRTVN